MLSRRAVLRPESTLDLTWLPTLLARQRLRRSNWVSSTIRTRRLMPAIPIARPIPLKTQYSLGMKGRDQRFATESLAYQPCKLTKFLRPL